MNFKFLPLLLLLFPFTGKSQSTYTPLRIDSLNHQVREIIYGDTLEESEFGQFFYNSSNQLIEYRTDENQILYTYPPNQEVHLRSRWVNNRWEANNRETYTYNQGVLISLLSEAGGPNNWRNSFRNRYFLDDKLRDTLLFSEFWTGQWDTLSTSHKTYNAEGLLVLRTERNINNPNNRYQFAKEDQLSYDSEGNLIESVVVLGDVDGNRVLSTKGNFWYQPNGLIDSSQTCRYGSSPNCIPLDRTLYDYDVLQSEGRRIRIFSWTGNDWQLNLREDWYRGPEVYSDLPDSNLVYQYFPPDFSEQLTSFNTNNYQLLNDSTVYLKSDGYTVRPDNTLFLFSEVEEWYYLENTSTNTVELTQGESFQVYPNPSQPSAEITLEALDNSQQKELTLLFFDSQGKLVSQQYILLNNSRELTINAPANLGIYQLLLIAEDQPIGAIKLIVQ